jgi:rhodanese-related sulfurtransferase
MGHRGFKNELYGQLARVGKAIASPARIELLDVLAQGPRTVEALATEIGLTVGNASAHLQALKKARLVESEKRGLFVHYRLADDSVAGLCQSLRTVAERRLAEMAHIMNTFLRHRDTMRAVTFQELRRLMRKGDVVLLDVRPAGEFEAGHIAGAISVPPGELENHLASLPKNKQVVAYCRGPYCVFADEAVENLRRHRRRAVRLEGGFPEWRSAGLPVEEGATR